MSFPLLSTLVVLQNGHIALLILWSLILRPHLREVKVKISDVVMIICTCYLYKVLSYWGFMDGYYIYSYRHNKSYLVQIKQILHENIPADNRNRTVIKDCTRNTMQRAGGKRGAQGEWRSIGLSFCKKQSKAKQELQLSLQPSIINLYFTKQCFKNG